jgi:hypothetical protein
MPRGRGGSRARQDWAQADSHELLAAGFAAESATLKALQQRLQLTNAEAASVHGVHPRTYRGWLADGNAAPAAVRLLAILAGFVPWVGWDGWEVERGLLFPPGYRKHGIAPGEFFALVFYRQQVGEQRRLIVELESQIAKYEAERQVLEERIQRLQNAPWRRPRRGRRVRSALGGAEGARSHKRAG